MRKQTKVFGLAILVLLFIGPSLLARADDDGKLKLDPNIITNQGAGASSSNDFAIRNELFTSALNQKDHALRKDETPQTRQALSFDKPSRNSLYSTNTNQVTQDLFTNYKPQVITSKTNQTSSQSSLFLWLIGATGLVLIVVAIVLGRLMGKRKLRRTG